FRYPEEILSQELYQYTLMPAHMRQPFTREELAGAELVGGLVYARGVPVLRVPVIPSSPWYNSHGPRVMEDTETAAYDLVGDPGQLTPIADLGVLAGLAAQLAEQLGRNDAPQEVYRRLGLANVG
ncbi:MAG: sulfatase, partial [Devosia sp.]